jgi:hypothetical protein
LIGAVLERAVLDAVGDLGDVPVKDRAKIQKSARGWISRNRDGMFSFLWCCGMLDLDAGAIRERVRKVSEPL